MTLQKLFPGYLGKTDEDFARIWDTSIIFFDANVLLSLYTYSDETFKEFEKVLTHEKFSRRIFITYQVGSEFSRNRNKRISHQLEAYNAIISKIVDTNKEIDDWMRKEYRFHSAINIGAVSEGIKKAYSEAAKEIGNIDIEQMNARFKRIDAFIYEIIEDRITEKPSDERMREIFILGKQRYEKSVPPGFEDRKKSDDARLYGDLINWLEIIKYISESDKKSVIFVTDDLKDDWWWRESGKIIGAHPMLIQEMLEKKIIYHQYTSEAFIKYGSEKIGTNASVDSLTELRTVANRSQDSDESSRISEIMRDASYTTDLHNADKFFNAGLLSEINYCEVVFSITEIFFERAINKGYNIKSGFLQQISEIKDLETGGLEQAFSHMPIDERARFAKMISEEVIREEKSTKVINLGRYAGISAAVLNRKHRKDAEFNSSHDYKE